MVVGPEGTYAPPCSPVDVNGLNGAGDCGGGVSSLVSSLDAPPPLLPVSSILNLSSSALSTISCALNPISSVAINSNLLFNIIIYMQKLLF